MSIRLQSLSDQCSDTPIFGQNAAYLACVDVFIMKTVRIWRSVTDIDKEHDSQVKEKCP